VNRREKIHNLIEEISNEVFLFIREHECSSDDGWVPTAQIKSDLDLNFVAIPRGNQKDGAKGWLFATIARLLEDKDLIEYTKVGGRAYVRTKKGGQ